VAASRVRMFINIIDSVDTSVCTANIENPVDITHGGTRARVVNTRRRLRPAEVCGDGGGRRAMMEPEGGEKKSVKKQQRTQQRSFVTDLLGN